MTKTYQVTGMTCSHCENKVKSNLLLLPEIAEVKVSRSENTETITMESPIELDVLQDALGGASSNYQISDIAPSQPL